MVMKIILTTKAAGKMDTKKIVIALLIIFVFFPCCFGGMNSSNNSTQVAKSSEPVPTKSPEEIAKEEKENTDRGIQFIRVREFKKNLHDPESFELIKAIYLPDGSDWGGILCIEYRAKNGFGALRLNQAAFIEENYSVHSNIWNKHCAGKSGQDMQAAINWVL